jgi:hypothetical protein
LRARQALRVAVGTTYRAFGTVIRAIRFINPLGGFPGVIADREAMYGDDPDNDPRRMDFDPNRRTDRRREHGGR